LGSQSETGPVCSWRRGKEALWLHLRIDFLLQGNYQGVQRMQIFKLRWGRIQRDDDFLNDFRRNRAGILYAK
jgi:hypothetical protein